MTIGEKIKKICTFGGMTQKEFGLAIGREEKGADNRIAQYEINYRFSRNDLLTQTCNDCGNGEPSVQWREVRHEDAPQRLIPHSVPPAE